MGTHCENGKETIGNLSKYIQDGIGEWDARTLLAYHWVTLLNICTFISKCYLITGAHLLLLPPNEGIWEQKIVFQHIGANKNAPLLTRQCVYIFIQKQLLNAGKEGGLTNWSIHFPLNNACNWILPCCICQELSSRRSNTGEGMYIKFSCSIYCLPGPVSTFLDCMHASMCERAHVYIHKHTLLKF